MEYWWILYIIDGLLFLATALTVAYMTVFSIAAMFGKRSKIKAAKIQKRFIVIIPAYKADHVVEKTVKAILGQTYPQRLFDVVVISDHQSELTNFKLAQYPITLLTANFKYSTKGKSLQYAIKNLPEFKIYDIVVILDADNLVLPEFLDDINNAYQDSGTKAIQAHRMSKNRDTASAQLDATFEEINNTIFRRGHIAMGLSAATAGSGMAFDFQWFQANINKIDAAWEDKQIEALLMRQHIFVDYFDDILVFDEKTRATDDFNRQRRRWATTQFHMIMSNIHYLPSALFNKQYDLIDKIFQWMLIPRTVMMGIIVLMGAILPFVYMTLALKWWFLFGFVLFVFAAATPDYLVTPQWEKAFLKSPLIMLSSLLNIAKIAKRKKKFVNKN